jgi:hypothetical protein
MNGDSHSTLEFLVARLPRMRFTVRRLMAAAAVVALVLALVRGVRALNELEAGLLCGVCYFVVPPTLVIMFLRRFDPDRRRQ